LAPVVPVDVVVETLVVVVTEVVDDGMTEVVGVVVLAVVVEVVVDVPQDAKTMDATMSRVITSQKVPFFISPPYIFLENFPKFKHIQKLNMETLVRHLRQ
jgi:hypothetical protein